MPTNWGNWESKHVVVDFQLAYWRTQSEHCWEMILILWYQRIGQPLQKFCPKLRAYTRVYTIFYWSRWPTHSQKHQLTVVLVSCRRSWWWRFIGWRSGHEWQSCLTYCRLPGTATRHGTHNPTTVAGILVSSRTSDRGVLTDVIDSLATVYLKRIVARTTRSW